MKSMLEGLDRNAYVQPSLESTQIVLGCPTPKRFVSGIWKKNVSCKFFGYVLGIQKLYKDSTLPWPSASCRSLPKGEGHLLDDQWIIDLLTSQSQLSQSDS